MNDRHTLQNDVGKPSGPKKRRSLFELRRDRFDDQTDTMSKKESLKNGSNCGPVKVGLKTQRKSTSPSSPSSQSSRSSRSNHSSPVGDERDEFLRHRGGSLSPNLYPDLDEFKEVNDKLDIYRSTSNANRSRDTSSSSIGSKPSNDRFSPKFTPESKKYPKRNKDKQSNTSMRMIIIRASPYLLLLAIAGYFYLSHSQNSNAKVDSDVFDDVNSKINDIVKLFPSQDEGIWSYFTAGIAEVKNKMHRPAIFLLLASDDDTTAICLAKKVAEVTRSTLGGTGNAILGPGQLENDIDKVFKLIKEQVTRTKTAILLDLLNLQPQAIRALHDICDPDNPLVEEAVYLIIMKSELYKESEKLVAFAEQQLNNSFLSVISQDILRPLITRITAGAVLPVRAEKNLPCSKYDMS